MDNIFAFVAKFFGVPEDSVNRETSAKDISSWDSLKHIQLMMEIEKVYRLRLKNSEIARLTNVGDLEDLLRKRGVS